MLGKRSQTVHEGRGTDPLSTIASSTRIAAQDPQLESTEFLFRDGRRIFSSRLSVPDARPANVEIANPAGSIVPEIYNFVHQLLDTGESFTVAVGTGANACVLRWAIECPPP